MVSCLNDYFNCNSGINHAGLSFEHESFSEKDLQRKRAISQDNSPEKQIASGEAISRHISA